MPRDASGNYSLPAGNPVITGTTIESAGWGNPTMADLAAELTNSLDRAGRGPMTGQLKAVAGTVGAPGITWAVDLDSGWYRAGGADFRFSIDNTDKLRLGSNALRWYGATAANFQLSEGDADANEKIWRIDVSGGNLSISTLTDAEGAGADAVRMLRTATVVDEIELNATLFDLNGAAELSGTLLVSGKVTGEANFESSGATPRYSIFESDHGTASERYWSIRANAGVLFWEMRDAADANPVAFITVTRAAQVCTEVQIDATALDMNGDADISGDLVVGDDATIGGDLAVAGTFTLGGSPVTLASGTYTPILTNGANVAASTPHDLMYIRVGNIVYVAGELDLDPTSAGVLTVIDISLPIASNLGNADQVGGAGADPTGSPGYSITGSAANDRAIMSNGAIVGTASRNVKFSFSYRVI